MLIRRIALLSPSPERIGAFYAEQFGLPVETAGGGGVRVAAGETVLEFRPAAAGRAVGPYHYAFNIAPNRMLQARRWLRERAPLVCGDGGDDLFEFADWNAHAMYFRDPDGNLAEFIARHDLPPAADADPFCPRHILAVGELGIVVPDVAAAVDFLRREFDLPFYRGNRTDFAAVGDPRGLFVVVRQGRPWFPTKDMTPGPSPAEAVIEGGRAGRGVVPGGECGVEAK